MKSFIKWCNSGSQEEGYLLFCFGFFKSWNRLACVSVENRARSIWKRSVLKCAQLLFFGSVVFPGQTPSTVLGEEGYRRVRNH